jgi:peptide/nickel transport system permease protein
MKWPSRRITGAVVLAALAIAALGAPILATHPPSRQFPDYVQAPPMLPRVIDAQGGWHPPFVYPLRLENRLERRYAEDRSQRLHLRWFTGGSLVSADAAHAPWFPLGTDALGRDVFARLVSGARLSLGVAGAAALGALLIGAAIGALAGFFGGYLDEALMRVADFVVSLPAIYVVLALRAAMPLVLTTTQIFWTMVWVMALVGWPIAARGVRALISTESRREYAEAARALGASRTRLLLRHLMPATWGFLAVQATLLVPAFVIAEATLSFVGLGFGEPSPSWGLMLQEAARGRALVEAPWLLAPAIAIVLAALGVNLIASQPAAHVRAHR